MFDNVATLYSAVETQDNVGNVIETLTGKQVFVKPRSVYSNDFYAAATTGLKPEVVLQLFFADYNGEKTVEYDGITYEVIRAYRRPESDTLELTLQKVIG